MLSLPPCLSPYGGRERPHCYAMTLKTLHITNSRHPTSGGISTFYKQLLAAANRDGRPLRLIVPDSHDGVEEAGSFGRIYHVRGVLAPFNPNYRLIMPDQYLAPGGLICDIMRAEKPQLIEICDKYCFSYLGGLLRRAWLPGVHFRPTMVGLSCERMDENVMAYVTRDQTALRLVRYYMRHLYFPMFDHHIANSDHTAAELRIASRFHDVPRGVWVCPMGVDCADLGPEHRSTSIREILAAEAGGRLNSVLLLYAGRLVREKHLGLLIDVIERLAAERCGRDFRLLMAGSGPLQDELRAAAARLAPGRVHFLGHIGDRARLAALYANCDVFVHPNPHEPFGIAPLEAMASGLPLVAPDAGGILTYANAANAWLAPANPTAFAAAIQDAVNDPDRDKKIRNARATAGAYRWETVTAQYFRLYEDLHALRTGRKPHPELAPSFYSVRRPVGAGD
jgi:alpha-1,6-mannosyltransferase